MRLLTVLLRLLFADATSDELSLSRKFLAKQTTMCIRKISVELFDNPRIDESSLTRVLGALETMFNTLLSDLTRSDRELNQVALKIMGICSGEAEYLHLSRRGQQSSFYSKFAINMLSISNVHALEFDGFFVVNPARQQYMARFLRLSARVGFAVDEMERLYDQLEFLPSIKLLAERVQRMENAVRSFVDNSLVGTEPPIFFRQLFLNSTGDGLYNDRHIRERRSDILVRYNDFKSSLIGKAQLITSDARVGIFPRVIDLIDSICSDLSRSRSVDSLALPFIELMLSTVVRVAQNPDETYSLVVLRKFISEIRSRFLSPLFDGTPSEVAFLVFHESVSRHFRINILAEYPDLIRRWSPEKRQFLGRIIESFLVLELPLDQPCAELLAYSEDGQLEIAARVVSDIIVRHMRLRRKGIFEEVPLVDPYQFIKAYLENPTSPFASWVVDRQLVKLPIGLPQKKNEALPVVLQRMIQKFFGYPSRFMEMSQRLSAIYQNTAGRSIQKLIPIEYPGILLQKEIEWDMLETGESAESRSLLERGVFAFIELLQAPELVGTDSENVKAVAKCKEKVLILRRETVKSPFHGNNNMFSVLSQRIGQLYSLKEAIIEGRVAEPNICLD